MDKNKRDELIDEIVIELEPLINEIGKNKRDELINEINIELKSLIREKSGKNIKTCKDVSETVKSKLKASINEFIKEENKVQINKPTTLKDNVLSSSGNNVYDKYIEKVINKGQVLKTRDKLYEEAMKAMHDSHKNEDELKDTENLGDLISEISDRLYIISMYHKYLADEYSKLNLLIRSIK